MKKILLASFALMAYSATLTSCKKADDNNPVVVDSTDRFNYTTLVSSRTANNTPFQEPANGELSGTIKTNTVLKTGKTYLLKGFVYVAGGATLKIEPGVIIKGDKASKGSLIVTRNGKIDAQGTAAAPIIFTSSEATPNYGDWGGVILLGNSTNNSSYSGTAGLQEIEGGVNNSVGYGLHGGTDVADNSGIMKYVRIEYPGIAYQVNNEINGLTFGSVGSGTTIDYIQVYKSGDDSYEWFGGTVNCKHLIAYAGTDDDFDTDNGFSGNIQFGIGFRDPAVYDAAPGGTSNGFESDNDGNGSTATPLTAAVFSNMTLIGPKANNANPPSGFGRGAHIRRNSSQSVFNSVFVGWNTGVRVDGKLTADHYLKGEAFFQNNFVVNASKLADTAGGAANASAILDPATFFLAAAQGNTLSGNLTDAMLVNLAKGSGFNPAPIGGSPALTGAAFNSGKLSGMQTVSYRGALASGDTWHMGWTKW